MTNAFGFAIKEEAEAYMAQHGIAGAPLEAKREAVFWLVPATGTPVPTCIAQPAIMDELATLALCDELARGITPDMAARASVLAASIRARHADEIKRSGT